MVLNYSYFNKDNNLINKEISQNLKVELNDNKLSVLKFIYKNTPTRPNSPFNEMMSFIDRMLWYCGTNDKNEYSGFTNGPLLMLDELYYSNKLKDFENCFHNSVHAISNVIFEIRLFCFLQATSNVSQ